MRLYNFLWLSLIYQSCKFELHFPERNATICVIRRDIMRDERTQCAERIKIHEVLNIV